MKSPKVKGIGEVVTEYGAKVMKIFKKGLLQRSLFDFYGDVKANAIRVKESSSVPQTPVDNDGGVVYVKNSDGKLYYKSNEVSEVELSASDNVLTTEQVQDIAGPLVATGGTKTGITITYDDANNNMDFVVDHDAATNFVAEEHYRWDNDIQSTATINHANLSSDTGSDGEVLVVIDGDAVWGHPEKIHLQVRNDEGATIPAGAPLYSRGEIGGSNRIKVGVCDADDSSKMPCIGLAEAEMNTTSTKDNFAITQGIYNTNISGFTGLAVGDTLYVDTSGSAPHLTKTKPTGESSLIQNVGIVLKTNGTQCQGLQVSAIGRTNDVPNLNSGYIFYGNVSNQAVSTQLSTLLPPDLTVDGAGTIHANNVPTLNQDTTGNAATATALTAGDKTIDGSLDIGSNTAGHDLNLYGANLNNATAGWVSAANLFKFTDSTKLGFGTANQPGAVDSSIQANGSNLVITNSVGNIQIGDTVEITGDLTTTGSIELGHASDTTIARSAAGIATIEGKEIITKNKVLNIHSYAYHYSGTSGHYIPMSGATTSDSTGLGVASYHLMQIMPFDGRVVRIAVYNQSATSRTDKFEMYINGDDSDLIGDQRGTDLSFTSARTGSGDCATDWTFSKEETIAIRRTPSSAVNGTTVTVVFEFDMTT